MKRSVHLELRDLLQRAEPASRERAAGDNMFKDGEAHYLEAGRTALRAILAALALAERGVVQRVLDLPSGYGRILRWLRSAFPDAEIVACDLERDGVAFCAEAFGAIPVESTRDLRELRLPGRFDLIWCGSLFTHLPLAGWRELMDLFDTVLEPGGVLVFSVHGRHCIETARAGATYGLRPADLARALEQVAREGFAYADYPNQVGYGISFSTAAWTVDKLLERGTQRLLGYVEGGLNRHQDIVACERI